MDSLVNPEQQRGGIHNYFQGATIHNMVINGNMTKNGSENFGSENKKRTVYSEEQVARALLAINGKDKVLNNYQLWLGACCYLMKRCDYSQNLERCCDQIAKLPYGMMKLEIECKYENIRKFSFLKFVKEGIDTWDSYQPRKEEEKLFYGCKAVADELDRTLKQDTEITE